MHNYFLIEHNYSKHVIYNFKSELIIWKIYNVVKNNYCKDCNFRYYYKIISVFFNVVITYL